MLLRDGSVTQDPRLDALVEFDERSRLHPATVGVPSAAESVLWTPGPTTDQGEEGACAGHAGTGELTSEPVPFQIQGDLNAFAFSLYTYARRIDEYPDEDGPGTSVLAVAKSCRDKGLIKAFEWCFGIHQARVGIKRGPLVLGITWYDDMYEAPDGRLEVGGERVGRHSLLAQGYYAPEDEWLLKNSWGPKWGNGGLARISGKKLGELLEDDGEACLYVQR